MKDLTKIVITIFGTTGIFLMFFGGLNWIAITGILFSYIAWHLEFKTNTKE
jgi:preprotein translocase subunit SecE